MKKKREKKKSLQHEENYTTKRIDKKFKRREEIRN